MRHAMAGALLACLFSPAAFAAASVKANDPSGRRAVAYQLVPAANFICQPPELVELSKEVHRALCVQTDILANLKVTGPELKAAATSPFLQHPFLMDFQKEPYRGLDAITCRGDRRITCAHNSFWAFEDRPRPMGSPELAPYLGSPAENPAPAVSP